MNTVLKSMQVKVSHDTFDTRRFYPTNTARWNKSSFFTVGCINSFQSRIECNQLLELIAELHIVHADTRFLLIGDGPLRQEFLADIKRCKFGTFVTMAGCVRKNELPALMRCMHVVIQLACVKKGDFSQACLAQCRAIGLPVVTPVAEGIVQHNVTGLVSVDGSASAIATALACLRRSPALAERLGTTARQFALAREYKDLTGNSRGSDVTDLNRPTDSTTKWEFRHG